MKADGTDAWDVLWLVFKVWVADSFRLRNPSAYAVCVIGGLILSTMLTLVLIPAGFSLADGFEKRIGPWLRTRMLTYKPGDEDLVTPPRHGPASLPAE